MKRSTWLLFFAVLFVGCASLSAAFWGLLLHRAVARLGAVELPPMPVYGLELYRPLALDHDARRGRSNAVTVNVDEVLTIIARPAEPVVGPAVARAWLEDAAGVRRPWAVSFERTEQGTFVLQAPVAELPLLAPGRWRLFVVVGRNAGEGQTLDGTISITGAVP